MQIMNFAQIAYFAQMNYFVRITLCLAQFVQNDNLHRIRLHVYSTLIDTIPM